LAKQDLPGLFGKGVNFEYSKRKKSYMPLNRNKFSGFPKKIPIMATSDNKAVYISLFVSYRFGVVIDPLNPETNRFSYIFRRKRVRADF
jgi:hypothetical protein